MIQLSGAGKAYGPRTLFEDASWLIVPTDRIGLVGANGTGKSTLLRILAGSESLDRGTLQTAKGITAGYLPQSGLSLSGRTVFDECLFVFATLLSIESEMEQITRRLPELDHTSEEYGLASERLHRLESEFRNRDGYALEAQVGAVLSGLGFGTSDWRRHTEEFSGGWQMRIALAKLLLQKPNLLLLDEPTNHLDLEARNWLEEYLAAYPHAFIVVSHDRYFLDVTVRKTVEIWNRRLHFYAGNYTRYQELRAQRLTQLEAARRNQQEKIQQLEHFITRFRYKASKARQVQSRMKELERMERIELPPEEDAIRFTFPQPKPSGRVVAELRKVSKAYGDKSVLSHVNLVIERGDRVALVGVNGAGKSTLIKLLSGVEPLTAGSLTLGHNVETDYFAQDQYKELDPDTRMLDDLGRIAPRSTQTELRSLLGSFLFTEEDVFKPVGVLSGGERNRYALARMLLQPSNFLLLDEPTNHLDMRAKDVLLEALEQFTGTVVFVSHDRYFIDRLATRVFEVAGGTVNVYPGNYEDYVWRKQGALAPGQGVAEAIEDSTASRADAVPMSRVAPELRESSKPKRLNPIKLHQLRQSVSDIEEQVARLEAEIVGYERDLAVFRGAEESVRLIGLLEDRRRQMEALLAEWEQASRTLESGSG